MMKDVVIENQTFACPNPECKNGFASPVFVQNLNLGKTTSYFGCPRCLTEIRKTRGSEKGLVEQTKAQPIEVKATRQPFSQKCQHAFGYLSERSKEIEIPKECMTCEKLIKCMLLKLQKSDTSINEIRNSMTSQKKHEIMKPELEVNKCVPANVEPRAPAPIPTLTSNTISFYPISPYIWAFSDCFLCESFPIPLYKSLHSTS